MSTRTGVARILSGQAQTNTLLMQVLNAQAVQAKTLAGVSAMLNQVAQQMSKSIINEGKIMSDVSSSQQAVDALAAQEQADAAAQQATNAALEEADAQIAAAIASLQAQVASGAQPDLTALQEAHSVLHDAVAQSGTDEAATAALVPPSTPTAGGAGTPAAVPAEPAAGGPSQPAVDPSAPSA